MDLRMETSQAVSMLQPFRHPKPGLIIMDKAEELRRLIINDLYLNMDEDMATDTLERIDEYTQQVSRERAIEFAKDYYKYSELRSKDEFYLTEHITAYFDGWKSKQE